MVTHPTADEILWAKATWVSNTWDVGLAREGKSFPQPKTTRKNTYCTLPCAADYRHRLTHPVARVRLLSYHYYIYIYSYNDYLAKIHKTINKSIRSLSKGHGQDWETC